MPATSPAFSSGSRTRTTTPSAAPPTSCGRWSRTAASPFCSTTVRISAKAVGGDGVHVGQDDAPYREARRVVGDDAIVGVTCHASKHLAMDAAEAGADYVGLGAFFPTTTKEARFRAEIELLRWWSEIMTVPVVAIGGITVDNCRPLVEAGADFLAVSAGVWAHPDGPAAAVQAFNRLFAG